MELFQFFSGKFSEEYDVDSLGEFRENISPINNYTSFSYSLWNMIRIKLILFVIIFYQILQYWNINM